MKKIIITLVSVLLFVGSTMAKPVDVSTAQRVATHFWNAHHEAGVAAVSTPLTQVALPFDAFYLFVNGENGFVFVAADDCVQPILGYSFTSPANENLNPEVRYWLNGYQLQIEALRAENYQAPDEVEQQWALYSNDAPLPYTPLTAVAPLLSTTWSQSPYYNALCPYDDANHGRSVTGCVATATAQVMKYWNHPAQGSGAFSYIHDSFGPIGAIFEGTTYDWANMPNSLNGTSSEAQVNAVATLMYHVGVSIEMDYSASSSGAYTYLVGYSLPRYFGYKSDNVYRYRDDWTDAQWASLINIELDAARPVIYAGSDTSGGHCFVCDGYNNSNQYHFNWGWGGWCDGYYLLSNLAPSTGGTGSNTSGTYNLNQRIFTGIRPDSNYVPSNYFAPDPTCLITTLPYTQNFDDTNAYGCLRVVDIDDDGETWDVSAVGPGVGGSRCAFVQYAYQPNDFLIFPGIATPGNYMISWKTRVYNADYPETYEVYAGKNRIFVETFDDTNYVSRTAFFSVAPGDTVLPMFHYISEDMYVLLLDNVVIDLDTTPDPCVITAFPYFEGFEDTSTLGCWGNIDADGDSFKWELASNSSSPIGYSSPSAIASASWNQYLGPLTPNNWLISSAFVLPAGQSMHLKWYAKGLDANDYAENYAVYVSTTGNSVTDFTTTLYNGTTTNAWVQHDVDLSSYAGQTIYLAFRHYNTTDMYYLLIDNIEISVGSAPVTNYTLTVLSNNNAWGTVSGGGSYAAGATATLTATANSGYHFVSWQDGNTSNPRTVTVTADATFTATFAADAPNPPTPSDTCTITSLPYIMDFENGAPCWSLYNANGDTITWGLANGYGYNSSVCAYISYAVNADDWLISPPIAVSGNLSVSWKAKVMSSSYPETYQVWVQTADTTVMVFSETLSSQNAFVDRSANFTVPAGDTANVIFRYISNDMYYLFLDNVVISNGSAPVQNYTLTVLSNNNAWGTVTGGGTYTSGATATLTATANSGYHFVQWQDGVTSNPRTVTVTADATYTATFAADAPAPCSPISQFPYVQDFETADVYDCFTFIDADGDGYNWMTNYLFNQTDEAGNYQGHNGSHGMAASASWNQTDGALTPDNWMVLPAMALPAGSQVTLTWFDKGQDASYAAEHYSVYVSTTGTAVANFTNQMFTITTSAAWTQRTVNLSNFAGQTIYIAFRHYDVSDQFVLDIDDIRVETTSAPTQYTLTVVSNNNAWGTVTGGGTYAAGATATLTATANNGYHFVQWQDGNTQNPRTVTVTGNATYVATFAQNVGVEMAEETSWSLYPNPATSQVTIDGIEGQATVTVVDMAGRVSGEWTVENGKMTIDVSLWAQGTYFVRVATAGESAVRKLIVK